MDTNKYAQMYISVIRLYYFRYICHVLSVKSIWPDWMINFIKSQKLQILIKLGSDSENFSPHWFWRQCEVIELSQLLLLLVQKLRSSTNVKCSFSQKIFCDQHGKKSQKRNHVNILRITFVPQINYIQFELGGVLII